MFSQRVCPKGMWVFGVADGYVAAHAFGIAFTCEDAEGACHVLEHVATVRVERDVFWDTREADALADCFEGGFFFLFDLEAGVRVGWFGGFNGHCAGGCRL